MVSCQPGLIEPWNRFGNGDFEARDMRREGWSRSKASGFGVESRSTVYYTYASNRKVALLAHARGAGRRILALHLNISRIRSQTLESSRWVGRVLIRLVYGS